MSSTKSNEANAMNNEINLDSKKVLKDFIGKVISDASSNAGNNESKKITAMDIVYALKRNGRTLYGIPKQDGEL